MGPLKTFFVTSLPRNKNGVSFSVFSLFNNRNNAIVKMSFSFRKKTIRIYWFYKNLFCTINRIFGIALHPN